MIISLSVFRFTTNVTVDITPFHIFQQVIVVLSSTKGTKDPLEKRGDIYSDRPAIPFYEMYMLHLLTPAFLSDMAQDGVWVVVAACKICRAMASRSKTSRP